jgi:uncharacterized protein (TIGR03083 family)
MIESFVAAGRLPQTDPHQAAGIGQAEGGATLALLRALGDGDWRRPTDCTEWDVRALVAHLVAQCEDSIRLGTLLRRELVGRRRYPGRTAVDAHMAVGVDDHRKASGPELVERFALLWPRAVRARRRRPGFLRRLKINSGIPGQPRWPVAYLLDVILNRDLWMHRVDLSRATGRPLVSGGQTSRSLPRSSAIARSGGRLHRWRWSSPAPQGASGYSARATRWRSSAPTPWPTCAPCPAATTTWCWS